LHSSI